MTTNASKQYHFSHEQRTQLGQVYKVILSGRQERLAQNTPAKTPIPDSQTEHRHLLGDDVESSEV